MAIALRAAQASKSAAANSTSIVMTVPTGTLNGDIMIMYINNRNFSITDPSGWTLLITTATGPQQQKNLLACRK